MKRVAFVLALVVSLTAMAYGQGFSSGSTGADGALDLSVMTCAGADGNTCTVNLPASGILNYTTVNIPGNKTLVFRRNLRNTPVIMLVQGNVNVAGIINVSAPSAPNFNGTRDPGPGGFPGGASNQPGFGPGGGAANNHGRWVGPLSLVPIIGGSGGGGSGGNIIGGGGGGAIVIASSTSIAVSGYIIANGTFSGGYGGAAGAIRLVANSITITGTQRLIANSVSPGVIRLEAPQGAITFDNGSSPPAVLSTINPVIVPSVTPSLTIASIGGFAVPSYSGTSFSTIDVLLPNSLTDPIPVNVQASNIPVGTEVRVTINGSPGAGPTQSVALQGTLASSTATLNISGLSRSLTAVSYLFVSATFVPPNMSQLLNPPGKDQIAKVRITSAPGAKPKLAFLRRDGSEIDPQRLSPALLQEFGMQ